jgi:hypothetical protein
VHRVVRTPGVRAALFVVVASALSACGGGSSATTFDAIAQTAASSTSAGALRVAGPRADAAVAGQHYEFMPELADPGADSVTYAIENKPRWATFDGTSGALSGVPADGDVGSRQRVRVSASVRGATAVHEFDLQVVAQADGTAEVALDAPVTRTDGSSLGNLAGYRIYYGKTATRLDRFVDVKDASAPGAQVSGLTPGTWYFAAIAYDASGFESAPTDVGSKTIG